MRLRYAALVALAGLALSGLGACAAKDSSSPVTAPAPSIGSPAPSPVPPSGTSPSGKPSLGSTDPKPSGQVVAIRGTIRDGVEPGCVLLATDSQTYLLIGGDRAA